MKLVTLLITSLYSTQLFAATITCPTGILKATTANEDNEAAWGDSENLVISLESEDSEAMTTFEDGLKSKIEISVIVDKDEYIDGLYQMNVATFVDSKRQSKQIFLTANRGISTGGGWDLGPKGTTKLHLLYPGTLSESPMNLELTHDAFAVLKKYGLKSATERASLYPLYSMVREAVQKGDLKEGQVIGTIFVLGCWLQK